MNLDFFIKDDKTGEQSDTTKRAWLSFLVIVVIGIIRTTVMFFTKVNDQVINFFHFFARLLGITGQGAYTIKRLAEKKEEKEVTQNPVQSTDIETPQISLIDRLKEYAMCKYGVTCNEWVMFAVRGATVNTQTLELIPNDNKVDKYNDSIILLKGADLKYFQASIDPGQYWIDNPMNEGGAARLEPGLYKYKTGKHKGKPAFNQASKVRVMRDVDRDGIWVREPIEEGYFGINIHWSYTLDKVGKDSAGCIVLKSKIDGKEWQDFYNTLSPQKEFYVIIVDGEV